jgi:hypothetical protein
VILGRLIIQQLSPSLFFEINLTLHSWWRGTLNEAEEDSFTLRFAKGRVIVFKEYKGLAAGRSICQ